MPRVSLSRRHMLRGIVGGTAVAIGLPPLAAMLDGNGTAFAGGEAIPRRFGLWFWGNGVKPQQWMPSATGNGWLAAPPPSLLPFQTAGVLDRVSLVTRTWVPFAGNWAHHTSHVGLMTASQPLDDNGVPDYDSGGFPSHGAGPEAIDEITSEIGVGTKFDRVTASVSRGQGGADYLEGDVQSSEFNPQAMYAKLFADFVPGAEQPSQGLVDARKSVLAAVRDDASALRAKLGAGDRERLDRHLDSIADIEAAVGNFAASCALPPDPGPRLPDLEGNGEPLEETNRAMADLVAYALACDLTRVFDFRFSRVQGYPHFWQVGAPEGHHELGHAEGGDQPKIQATISFIMEQLAYLCGKLDSIPVGDDSLLDHCCIWGTSEQEDPQTHSFYNTPNLVIGRCGGALKGGIHVDAGGNPDWYHRLDVPEAVHAGVILTMMRALGMDRTGFGVGDGYSEHVIDALLG
jgi:Protein of unknown function (DUF1552)